MTVPPAVSVLVVNYNGARHLPACLRALAQQTLPRERFEVIVVDNASADGSADIVPRDFPWAKLVRLPTNAGFAEGNNVARRHARGAALVLLNNDTLPDPHWLAELLRLHAEDPTRMVVSKLVFAGDPGTINSGGLFLTRDGRGADAGFRATDVGQFEVERPVFAGCGAAVLIPATRGDIFDGELFMYYEDVDLGWRRQLAGLPAIYAPRALVRHVHGAAAGDASPLFRYYVERNRALTSLRLGDPFLAGYSALVLAAKLVQAVLQAARGRTTWRHAAAVARAAFDYTARLPRTLTERGVARCGW